MTLDYGEPRHDYGRAHKAMLTLIDREQFERAWKRLEQRNLLQGIFFRVGIPSEDIPDLINETAIQAMRCIGNLCDWGGFDQWIVGVARNVSHRYWRDKKNRQAKLDRAIEFAWTNPAMTATDNAHTDNSIIIEECLNSLSTKERTIVHLRAVKGYKWEEIAKEIKIPKSTVARYYENALAKLKANYLSKCDRCKINV